jgi:hypothetical protein
LDLSSCFFTKGCDDERTATVGHFIADVSVISVQGEPIARTPYKPRTRTQPVGVGFVGVVSAGDVEPAVLLLTRHDAIHHSVKGGKGLDVQGSIASLHEGLDRGECDFLHMFMIAQWRAFVKPSNWFLLERRQASERHGLALGHGLQFALDTLGDRAAPRTGVTEEVQHNGLARIKDEGVLDRIEREHGVQVRLGSVVHVFPITNNVPGDDINFAVLVAHVVSIARWVG